VAPARLRACGHIASLSEKYFSADQKKIFIQKHLSYGNKIAPGHEKKGFIWRKKRENDRELNCNILCSRDCFFLSI
jgi:hypothetical protein